MNQYDEQLNGLLARYRSFDMVGDRDFLETKKNEVEAARPLVEAEWDRQIEEAERTVQSLRDRKTNELSGLELEVAELQAGIDKLDEMLTPPVEAVAETPEG